MPNPILVERNADFHRGPACYRSDKRGRVTVMCPYGHLVESIEPGDWGTSVWLGRSSFGGDTVTCHGFLKAEAKPYPFADTFLGAHAAVDSRASSEPVTAREVTTPERKGNR
jgi:hypothetical protein